MKSEISTKNYKIYFMNLNKDEILNIQLQFFSDPRTFIIELVIKIFLDSLKYYSF